MAPRKATTSDKKPAKKAPEKKAPEKESPAKKMSVYCVSIHRELDTFVYVKAESPEDAEQLAEYEGAAYLPCADDRTEWVDPTYECTGKDRVTDVEPDIGAEDEEESAEDDTSPVSVDPAVVKRIVASMVSIPGKDFKMGKFPVTQAQWEAVMGENPSRFKGANRPVEQVSWDDCQEFLKKLNALPAAKASGLAFRLPEDDEWEFACRAGATGDYCKLADGTEITEETLGEVAWFRDNSGDKTHPVGKKKPNAFGLYDMHGNVDEWTNTADGEYRVRRGGSWYDSARHCGSSYRLRLSPGCRSICLGFRLCASGRAD